MVIRVIDTAKALLKLHNFHSFMGVMAGLAMTAVSRLKHTFAKVPEKTLLVCDPSMTL